MNKERCLTEPNLSQISKCFLNMYLHQFTLNVLSSYDKKYYTSPEQVLCWLCIHETLHWEHVCYGVCAGPGGIPYMLPCFGHVAAVLVERKSSLTCQNPTGVLPATSRVTQPQTPPSPASLPSQLKCKWFSPLAGRSRGCSLLCCVISTLLCICGLRGVLGSIRLNLPDLKHGDDTDF